MYRKIKISPFVAVFPVFWLPVGEMRGGSKVKEEFRTEMTRTGRGSLKNTDCEFDAMLPKLPSQEPLKISTSPARFKKIIAVDGE